MYSQQGDAHKNKKGFQPNFAHRSLKRSCSASDALINEIALAAKKLSLRNRMHLLMLIEATQKHEAHV